MPLSHEENTFSNRVPRSYSNTPKRGRPFRSDWQLIQARHLLVSRAALGAEAEAARPRSD